MRNVVMALLLSAALALGLVVPASAEERQPSAQDVPAQLSVLVRVVGPDASGGESEWVQERVTITDGQTAWQATEEALSVAGLTYQTLVNTAGESLASLANPEDGTVWGSNASTGDLWRLFVNGSLQPDGASACKPEDGDEILWYYHASKSYVTISAVGPGGTGEVFWLDPTTRTVTAGESAWDVSLAALEGGGFWPGSTLYYGVDEDGDVTLGSLSSLGPNGVTGESWQPFVNGSPAEDNVGHLVLHDGDNLCWYYANAGDTSLPAFAQRRIAEATARGAERIDGRVYTAWGRRLTSYLPATVAYGGGEGEGVVGADAPTQLRVLGDRLEVSLHGTVVELSCADGSVLSVSTGDRAGVRAGGDSRTGVPWADAALRDVLPLVPSDEASTTYVWGPDGSFYYIEATGVVYRLVVL